MLGVTEPGPPDDVRFCGEGCGTARRAERSAGASGAGPTSTPGVVGIEDVLAARAAKRPKRVSGATPPR